MHSIRAIIQPHMLGRVLRVLHELPHFPGCTVTELRSVIRIRAGEDQDQAV